MRTVLQVAPLVMVVAGAIYFLVADAFTDASDGLNGYSFAIIAGGGLAFAIVGLMLAARLPRLPIGWLFLGAATCNGIALILYALPSGGAHAIAVGFSLTTVTFGVAIVASFPNGHFRGRAWKSAGLFLWFVGALWIVDPLIEGVVGLPDWLWLMGYLPMVGIGIAGVVRLVGMFFRGGELLRRQLLWLVLVLVVGGFFLVASTLEWGRSWRSNEIGGVIMVVGAPVAIGLAVTRYRLYEIDRIVSRTISYTLVVAILAGIVAVVATLVGTQFDSPIVVAATTLGVAAIFSPLRIRVQGWVDRRFNRSSYDHEKVVEQFTSTLREGFDMEDLVQGWVAVVSDTMQPRQIGVWTRVS